MIDDPGKENSQDIESQEVGSTVITSLPTYTDENFRVITETVPSHLTNDDRLLPGVKDLLDPVNIWWRSQQDITYKLDRFKAATMLPGIPELEANEASAEFLALQGLANDANTDINGLINASKHDPFKGRLNFDFFTDKKFETVRGLSYYIHKFSESQGYSDQIIALCEAISETRELNLTEIQIRQRVAQYAWKELIDIVPYAKVKDNYLTTQDDLEIEKGDIKRFLQTPPFTHEELETASIIYEQYQKQMADGEYYSDVINAFEFLHNCVKGQIPTDKSAIHILQLQETILKALYREDAFLFNPKEFKVKKSK